MNGEHRSTQAERWIARLQYLVRVWSELRRWLELAAPRRGGSPSLVATE